MKYQTKPMRVDAFRYGYDDWPEWFKKASDEETVRIVHAQDDYSLDGCVITGEHPSFCPEGDYIICVKGTLTHQTKEVFEKTHTPIEDDEVPPDDDIIVKVPSVLRTVFGNQIRAMKHDMPDEILITFSSGFQGHIDTIERIERRAQTEDFSTVVHEEVHRLFDKEARVDL